MATYQVKAPDGKIVTLQGPDGASQDDILAQAQQLYQPAAPTAPAPVAGPPDASAAPTPPPALEASPAVPDGSLNIGNITNQGRYPHASESGYQDFINAKYVTDAQGNIIGPPGTKIPQPTREQQIAAGGQQLASEHSSGSDMGDALTAGIRSVPGVNYLTALAQKGGEELGLTDPTNASVSDIVDLLDARNKADQGKSALGYYTGALASGLGAGKLLGAGVGAAADAGIPLVSRAATALENLGTLNKGQTVANAAKIAASGAGWGGAEALDTNNNPIVGAGEGAVGALALGAGAKLAQVVSRPARDFLRSTSANGILNRLTTASKSQLQAVYDNQVASAGGEPSLLEILPQADRNKILARTVVGRDSVAEPTLANIRSRGRELGPEMAMRTRQILQPQRDVIETGMRNDLATARGGTPDPADADIAANAMTNSTDRSTLRDVEAQAIMANHQDTPVANTFGDILPQTPTNVNGTITMTDADPAVTASIRSATPPGFRVADQGVTAGDISDMIQTLRGDLGRGGIEGRTAQRAIDHLTAELTARAPEAAAAHAQMTDAYAARSRMLEGGSAGAATELRNSVENGTDRAGARLTRNAYDTQEGQAGATLGQSNKLISALGGSPDEALAATIGISRGGTSRELAQNVGRGRAGQIIDAAQAQDTAAQRLAAAANTISGGAGGEATGGMDGMVQALAGAKFRSPVATVAKLTSSLRNVGITNSRAQTLARMISSGDTGLVGRALGSLDRPTQILPQILHDLRGSIGDEPNNADLMRLISSVSGRAAGDQVGASQPAPPQPNFVPLLDKTPAAPDPYAKVPIAPTPVAAMGKREDGSEKGLGFLGLRQRPDGGVSSEISVGVNLGGKETEIPTMVPGLTGGELNYMLSRPAEQLFRAPYNKLNPIEKSIMDKATAYARGRVTQGLSPFRQPGEPSPIAAVNAAESAPAPTAAVGDDPNTPYGRQVISSLFPTAHITEDVRDPNTPLGKETPTSYHEKTQNAVDVRPIPGMTFQQFLGTIHDKGYRVVEAIDEVNHPSAHATGPHWHVVVVPGAGK